jgi:hypothetical protein
MALCLQNNTLRPIIEHSIVSLGNCLTDWKHDDGQFFSTPVSTYPFTGGTDQLVCDSSIEHSGARPRPGGFDFPNFSGS